MLERLIRFLLGIFLLFLFLPQVGWAQASQLNPNTSISNYEHRFWDKIDGVDIDRVLDIDQDEKGYMWLATNRGLLRFDSSKIEAYNFKNVPNLRTETIRFVEVGADNTIWFGTRRGLFFIVDKVAYEQTNPDGSPIAKILSLETDVHGIPYYTLDQTRKLYKIENGIPVEVEEAGSGVFKIFPGGNGKILGITYPSKEKGKIFKINQKLEFSFIELNNELIHDVYSLSEGPFGEIYAGLRKQRLAKIVDDTFEILEDTPQSTIMHVVQADNFGALYFSRNNGLERIYRGKRDLFSELDGLTNNNVLKIFFDRDGNLWVGTINGLNYFSKGPFTLYPTKVEDPDLLFNCVYQLEDETVIAGSNQSGLYELKADALVQTNIGTSLGESIYGLAKSKDANRFYLSTNKGAYLIEKEKGEFKVVDQINTAASGTIFERSNGEIWIVTKTSRSLTQVDLERLTILFPDGSRKEIDSLKDIVFREFLEDASGTLWMFTSSGTYTYNGNSEFSFEKISELNNYWITNHAVDREGRIWAGTLGTGLHLFEKDTILKFDTRNGMSVNQVQGLYNSETAGFWMYISDDKDRLERLLPYTDNGVQKIGFGEYYTFKHRFVGSNYFPHAISADDGSFLLAGANGLIRFNPKDIFYRQPRVRFDKLVADNQIFAKGDIVSFNSEFDDFEFHYSAVDFTRGESQIFEVKLEGLDEEWKSVGNRQVVYYSRLPAGKYTFMVRLITPEFGRITLDNPVSFVKEEVWYKRPKVLTFFGLLLAIFIYGVFQFRINQIKSQRAILELKVDERTAELNELNQNLEEKVAERTKEVIKINQELIANEERYKYALEASTDGIWDWDVLKDEIQYSPAIYTMLGYEPYEFPQTRGALYSHIKSDEIRRRHMEYHERIKKEADDGMLLDEYRMIGKYGNTVWIQVKGKVVDRNIQGKPLRIVGTHVDITKEKEKTQEILDAVLNTEFVERSRISRDIHDGLQQTLTISSLNFQWVKKDISKLTEKAKEKFEQGWKYLQSSIDESRNVAHSLMPKAVLDYGVIAAFDEMISEIDEAMEGTRFNFYHNFKNDKIENHQVEIILYRILQEALNNVTKYANAKTVTVQLKDYNDIYMLTIEDDGVGFDVEKLKGEGKGLGFKSMENRLDAINGFLEIESMPGRGTTILVEINK